MHFDIGVCKFQRLMDKYNKNYTILFNEMETGCYTEVTE